MMKVMWDLLERMPPAEKRTPLMQMRLATTGRAVLARIIKDLPVGELSAQLIELRESI